MLRTWRWSHLKERKRKKDNDRNGYHTQRKLIIVILLLTTAPLIAKIIQISIDNHIVIKALFCQLSFTLGSMWSLSFVLIDIYQASVKVPKKVKICIDSHKYRNLYNIVFKILSKTTHVFMLFLLKYFMHNNLHYITYSCSHAWVHQCNL